MNELAERYVSFDFLIHKKGKLLIDNELADQLTREQFNALRIIYQRKKVTSTDLIHLLYVDKSTISTLIRRLEDKQLILRDRALSDRRRVYLTLSPKGKRLYERCAQDINDLINQLLDTLSEEEAEHIFKIYQKIDRFLSEKVAELKEIGR